MRFQWIDYLKLAQELEKIGSQSNDLSMSEAMLRASISKAYYASFHVAVQYLEDEMRYDLSGNNEGSHWRVIDLLRKDKSNKIKSVGEELRLLRNARVKADYHLDCKELKTIQLVKQEARKALYRSHTIIKTLNSSMEERLSISK